jgi:hypothetical protein
MIVRFASLLMRLSTPHGLVARQQRLRIGALVDPNVAPVRTLPREERDLFIAANNGHVLAFDKLSALPTWLSDALCRLASGGSFAVRQLYTDQDEVLFDAARPIILNGIEGGIFCACDNPAPVSTLSSAFERVRRPDRPNSGHAC